VTQALALAFPSFALATLVGVPLRAWRLRGRTYAIFSVVVLALAVPGALLLHERLAMLVAPALLPVLHAGFAWGMGAAGLHLAALARARMRGRALRWLVAIPGMTFLATGALAGLWLVALLPIRVACQLAGLDAALTALRWLDVVPLVVGAASVWTSLRTIEEIVRIPLDDVDHPTFTRLDVARHRRTAPPLPTRPLRIVQVADPHLGPWQPVHRLRRRLERLAAHEPDLVLLTGDFLTMESAATPGALAAALEPLGRLPGRCFAVFGNHDHEARGEVRRGLAATGIQLLVDEATAVATPVGPIQILGADWVPRGHQRHLEALCARHPRLPGHLRILLLHDPLGFRHLAPGEVDLVLSGHTHGGQLGLLSLGLDWTVLARTRWPDHGLFARGTTRLYVHRGTGFYGFPMRVGVPGEASVLEVSVARPASA
jgi:predicted MPP superfamily phosphohydrolase